MTRTTVATIVAAAAALLAASQASAQDRVIVGGRVVESGTNRPLEDVNVTLGNESRVTDVAGSFRFERVPSGRWILEVSALGYRSREIVLDVVRDTTLTIALDVAPVPLDPLDVRARTVDVRGRVRDATLDIPVRDAEVTVAGQRTTTGVGGRFRVRRVPAGGPAMVVVRAFGYLPASVRIEPENDTTLTFELDEDPIARRMIEDVVEEIEVRSRAIPYARRHIDRDDLLRSRNFPVTDLLRYTLGSRLGRVQCVMIDDVQVPFGLEQLATYMPEELQYIEVLDGGGMIRVYTRRYISRRMGPEVELPPILFVKTPMGPMCR